MPPKSLKSNTPLPPVPFLNLPAQHQTLHRSLLAAFERVLQKSQFILGPEVKALEQEVASLCGVPFGVGVNSCTDAMLLALKVLDIGPGAEVIVPDFTFVATASAVCLSGARPVLVDVDPQTYTIDLQQVQNKLSSRTRAIIPVHLYGQMPDMEALMRVARRAKVFVIEDAAQALGAQWHGRPAGSWGAMGCISFYPTKNLGGLGDGGMVVTKQARWAERLRRLRDHGAGQKYYHQELGYNSRLDELQAAALRVKLPYLKAWNQRRQKIAQLYNQALQHSPVQTPWVHRWAQAIYHQYALLSPKRDALQAFLQAQGIGTAIHYPLPLHCQPLFKSWPTARGYFPVSTRLAKEVLCLPIAPEISDQEVKRVIAALKKFFSITPGRWQKPKPSV